MLCWIHFSLCIALVVGNPLYSSQVEEKESLLDELSQLLNERGLSERQQAIRDLSFNDFQSRNNHDCSNNPEMTLMLGSDSICPSTCGTKDWCGYFSVKKSAFSKEEVVVCRLYKECSNPVYDTGYQLFRRNHFRSPVSNGPEELPERPTKYFSFTEYIREKHTGCTGEAIKEVRTRRMNLCPARCGMLDGCVAFSMKEVTIGMDGYLECKFFTSCDQTGDELNTDLYRMKKFREPSLPATETSEPENDNEQEENVNELEGPPEVVFEDRLKFSTEKHMKCADLPRREGSATVGQCASWCVALDWCQSFSALSSQSTCKLYETCQHKVSATFWLYAELSVDDGNVIPTEGRNIGRFERIPGKDCVGHPLNEAVLTRVEDCAASCLDDIECTDIVINPLGDGHYKCISFGRCRQVNAQRVLYTYSGRNYRNKDRLDYNRESNQACQGRPISTCKSQAECFGICGTIEYCGAISAETGANGAGYQLHSQCVHKVHRDPPTLFHRKFYG